MKKSLWKKRVRKNASAKSLGPCDRAKGRIYTEEGKGIFIVQRRKRRGASIHRRSTVKRVHSTLQITANVTSTLCGKKERKKENSTRLSLYKPVDSKKWIPIASYHRYTKRDRKEEGVYKAGSEVRLQQYQNQGGRQMESSFHYAYWSI